MKASTNKSIALILGVCALLLAPVFALAEEGADKVADIDFEKMEHDFGDLFMGDPCDYTFKVFNKGSAPLIIESVKPSCGCTVPSGWEKEIAPGGSTKIDVKYDSKRGGSFNKTITVTTNDPDESRAVLRIKGNVKQEVNVQPVPRQRLPRRDEATGDHTLHGYARQARGFQRGKPK
jgi:hypothetical protein